MGIPVFIYSSGSIEAQKLLFGFSESGDLLKYLSGHFDTTIGSKISADSYTAIYQNVKAQLDKEGKKLDDISNILFVTGNYSI